MAVPIERRKGERHGQYELDGVVVERADRHLLLAPLAALLVEDPEGERRAIAGGDIGVVDDPVEGEVHVVGRERLPVVPGHVPAQMEGPGQSVVRVLPGLRQARLDLIVQPGDFGEALEEIPEDAG